MIRVRLHETAVRLHLHAIEQENTECAQRSDDQRIMLWSSPERTTSAISPTYSCTSLTVPGK